MSGWRRVEMTPEEREAMLAEADYLVAQQAKQEEMRAAMRVLAQPFAAALSIWPAEWLKRRLP